MNDLAMGGPNLSNNFLPTTRTAVAEARLKMLLQLGRQADYCKALPLLGPPGTGKTLFIKEYATLFEQKHKRKLRSLYVEVPSSATTNGLVSTILNRLGDAAPTHGIETAKVARIVKHMLNRFDILYLDEFHRLIDRNTEKVDKKAAGLVATLLNQCICPIVLVGEVQSERVFADSTHFEDRTFAPVWMTPFDWGLRADRREYLQMLAALEMLVGMPQASDLHTLDTAVRIYAFSRGVWRKTAGLIDTAAWYARDADSPSIRHEHLASAVDTIALGRSRQRPNPFRLDDPRPGKPAPMNPLDAEDE
jgi:hypothetical protein